MRDIEFVEDWCKANGVSSAGLKALAIAVYYGIAYRFQRGKDYNYQYEVEIPGYGKPAKKDNWRNVSVFGVLYHEL